MTRGIVMVVLVVLVLAVFVYSFFPQIRGAIGYRLPGQGGSRACWIHRGDTRDLVRYRCGEACGWS